jgi:hypothetical protein
VAKHCASILVGLALEELDLKAQENYLFGGRSRSTRTSRHCPGRIRFMAFLQSLCVATCFFAQNRAMIKLHK